MLVLEILKLKRFRQFQLRRAARRCAASRRLTRREVDASVAHELETGEFEVVRPE